MSEAAGLINWTLFFTIFREQVNGTEPEKVARNALTSSDKEGSGFIHEDHLYKLLTTMDDHFTDTEVSELFHETPIDKKGNFTYRVHPHP